MPPLVERLLLVAPDLIDNPVLPPPSAMAEAICAATYSGTFHIDKEKHELFTPEHIVFWFGLEKAPDQNQAYALIKAELEKDIDRKQFFEEQVRAKLPVIRKAVALAYQNLTQESLKGTPPKVSIRSSWQDLYLLLVNPSSFDDEFEAWLIKERCSANPYTHQIDLWVQPDNDDLIIPILAEETIHLLSIWETFIWKGTEYTRHGCSFLRDHKKIPSKSSWLEEAVVAQMMAEVGKVLNQPSIASNYGAYQAAAKILFGEDMLMEMVRARNTPGLLTHLFERAERRFTVDLMDIMFNPEIYDKLKHENLTVLDDIRSYMK